MSQLSRAHTEAYVCGCADFTDRCLGQRDVLQPVEGPAWPLVGRCMSLPFGSEGSAGSFGPQSTAAAAWKVSVASGACLSLRPRSLTFNHQVSRCSWATTSVWHGIVSPACTCDDDETAAPRGAIGKMDYYPAAGLVGAQARNLSGGRVACVQDAAVRRLGSWYSLPGEGECPPTPTDSVARLSTGGGGGGAAVACSWSRHASAQLLTGAALLGSGALEAAQRLLAMDEDERAVALLDVTDVASTLRAAVRRAPAHRCCGC